LEQEETLAVLEYKILIEVALEAVEQGVLEHRAVVSHLDL
jgi:hypothetical protein